MNREFQIAISSIYSLGAYMTVQTFIPNSAQAVSENTVTQPQHTPVDGSVKKLYIETQGCQMNEYDSHRMAEVNDLQRLNQDIHFNRAFALREVNAPANYVNREWNWANSLHHITPVRI